MPRRKSNLFTRLEKGGLIRDSQTISSHLMSGSPDRELLENSVSLRVLTKKIHNNIQVEAEIKNDKTGHHVPTGSPLRHMILLVGATDHIKGRLPLMAGLALPFWLGSGHVENGNYAGLPGKVFAKIPKELWTNTSPTGAY